ncbi:MAG: 3-dehydroquinate dehydratase [Sulfurimonas sp.]
MKISRGLAALILIIIFFQSQLLAEYLYKDEIISNPRFTKQVNILGAELYEKTGISLRLMMLKELPDSLNIAEYEKELLVDFNEPTVLLTFSEMNSKVDLITNDKSLYKYFNKKQILSPVASTAQAFAMAVIFARSWDDFNEMRGDSGGTILPLLANKSKAGEVLGKYSAAMFNGYYDVAQQIAASKNVSLENASANSNKNMFLFFKILFYGFLLYALYLYIKNRKEMKRKLNESK